MPIWNDMIEDLQRDYGIGTSIDHDEDGYTIIFKLAKPYEVGNQGFLINEEAEFCRMESDVIKIIWRRYRSERIKAKRNFGTY